MVATGSLITTNSVEILKSLKHAVCVYSGHTYEWVMWHMWILYFWCHTHEYTWIYTHEYAWIHMNVSHEYTCICHTHEYTWTYTWTWHDTFDVTRMNTHEYTRICHTQYTWICHTHEYTGICHTHEYTWICHTHEYTWICHTHEDDTFDDTRINLLCACAHSHMNESCHTSEWVTHTHIIPSMLHIWTCHMNTHEYVIHVTHTNTHEYTHEHDTFDVTLRNLLCACAHAYMNESCHISEWVTSHIWISYVTHMNKSCHTYEWVMSHIWMSHVMPHI